MNVKAILFILAASLLFCQAAATANNSGRTVIKGSGKVVSETRNISEISEVSLSGSVDLYIRQGEKGSLRVEAEDNVIPVVATEVYKKKLYIDIRPTNPSGSFMLMTKKPIKVYLTVKDLNIILTSGSGSITSEKLNLKNLELSQTGSGKVDLKLKGKNFTATITGSGNCTVSGETNTQQIILAGSGCYFAQDFQSRTCDIKLTGSGVAKVYADSTLNATLSGSGIIKYKGDASVTSRVSGSGKILPLN
jgi:hypothetical protein